MQTGLQQFELEMSIILLFGRTNHVFHIISVLRRHPHKQDNTIPMTCGRIIQSHGAKDMTFYYWEAWQSSISFNSQNATTHLISYFEKYISCSNNNNLCLAVVDNKHTTATAASMDVNITANLAAQVTAVVLFLHGAVHVVSRKAKLRIPRMMTVWTLFLMP